VIPDKARTSTNKLKDSMTTFEFMLDDSFLDLNEGELLRKT
jgi:hypothetical protein